MDTMSGLDFLANVHRQHPKIICMMLTGHAEAEIVINAVNEGHIHKFLTKPCSIKTLSDAITEGFHKYEANSNNRFTYSFTASNGNITSKEYSAACKAVTGYTAQELAAGTDSYLSIIAEEHKMVVLQHYTLLLAGHCVAPVEYQILHPDGRKCWLRETSMLLRDTEKGQIRCDGVIEDITESKRAYDTLQKSEEKFRAIANYTYDWESWIDSDGKLLWVNPAVERMTGYSDDECMEMRDYPMPIIHPNDRDIIRNVLNLAQNTGGNNSEFRFIRKDLQVLWGSISWQPLIDKDGLRKGHRSSVRDITESKHIRDALAEQNRLKSEFVSTVSHEMRTPLCIFKNIISNALAGVMGKTSPKMNESLLMANSSIDRLSRVINTFLDVDQIESGILTIEIASFDASEFIQEILKPFESLFQAKALAVTTNCTKAGKIRADRDKLTQILINLIGNAIKFTPSKGGRIDISIVNEDQCAVINVADNGRGIAQVDFERVFERFVQVDHLKGAGDHGTGLGLYITKKLVEMHGGTITVSSTPGVTTAFRVSLPAQS
jgi:hypothetical protein